MASIRKLLAKKSPEIKRLIQEERRQEEEAVSTFVDGVCAADLQRIVRGLEMIDRTFTWTKTMRRVTKLSKPPAWLCRRMLEVWISWGDHIRQEVDNDLLLTDALRVLLPTYRGPALRVYRGDSFLNRKHRTYSLSWTRNRQVAKGHALGFHRHCEEGSVLLEADAPPDAIICVVKKDRDRYGEEEVICDRRRLRSVRVLERYSHVPVKGGEHHGHHQKDAGGEISRKAVSPPMARQRGEKAL